MPVFGYREYGFTYETMLIAGSLSQHLRLQRGFWRRYIRPQGGFSVEGTWFLLGCDSCSQLQEKLIQCWGKGGMLD